MTMKRWVELRTALAESTATVRRKGVAAIIRELPCHPPAVLEGRVCATCGSTFEDPGDGIPRECSCCSHPSGAVGAKVRRPGNCPFCGRRMDLLQLYRHILYYH